MAEVAIIKALIEAKKKFKPLVKDKANPFFKSKYADLGQVYSSVEPALNEHGFVILQPTLRWDCGVQYIHTLIQHVSGDKFDSTYDLPQGLDPQKMAAAVTYGKRVALCALLGIASQDEDDDGESAMDRQHKPPPPAPKKEIPKPTMTAEKKVDAPKEYKVEKPAPASKPDQARAKDSKEPYGAWTGHVADIKTAEKVGWYEIVGGKGDKFFTDSEAHSDTAKMANLNKDMVRVEWKRSEKGNMIVQSIVVAEFKKD